MTLDDLDDLVDEWHTGSHPAMSLKDFIKIKTGWTDFQYQRWVVWSEIPPEPDAKAEPTIKMGSSKWQEGVAKGLQLWIAETAAAEVAEINQINVKIAQLEKEISHWEGSRQILLEKLPTGMPLALGYNQGNAISIMPHCYWLAHLQNITVEEAKKQLLEQMKSNG